MQNTGCNFLKKFAHLAWHDLKHMNQILPNSCYKNACVFHWREQKSAFQNHYQKVYAISLRHRPTCFFRGQYRYISCSWTDSWYW